MGYSAQTWMILIAIALLMLPVFAVHGKELSFSMERLTTEQGLSQSIVYSMFQDRQGFLWFGTRDGINRYDGYGFTVFRHEPFDSSSIPWTSAAAFGEDRDGNIWLGSRHGAGRLDRHSFRFTSFIHSDSNPRSLSNNDVRCIASDRAGNVWIGTEEGLNRFDAATGICTRFLAVSGDPRTLGSNLIVSLFNDPSGTLWVGTAGGYIHRLNPDGRSFTRFDAGLGNYQIICLGGDGHGQLYISLNADPTRSVVAVFNPVTGRSVRRFQSLIGRSYSQDYMANPMCLDSLGGLWIQVVPPNYSPRDRTSRELHRIQLDGSIAPIRFQLGQVWTVQCDRAGIIWAGTLDGVVKLKPERNPFINYRSTPDDPWSLSNNRIRAILRDRLGTLWVGTDDGLNSLDESTGRWTRYFHDPKNPGSISDDIVSSIFEDADGALLFGTYNGINVFNRATGRFSRICSINEKIEFHGQRFIWSFNRDSLGRLWVGTLWHGIELFDRDGVHLRNFPLEEGVRLYGRQQVVWDMHRDRRGVFWAGTTSGLYRWMPERDSFMRYSSGPRTPYGLSDDNVCAIMEDSSGTLWFTTYGGGLNRYDHTTDRFTAITTGEGLPGNAIYGTLMDDHGRLWTSSNTGLSVYDPRTAVWKTYTTNHGLQGNEFSFKAFHKSKNGELFFGGTHGVSRFHPDSLRESVWKAPVVITEFRIFDTLVRHELSARDTVTITHDQSFISFEFAALDYSNPAGIRYAYRLEGFDDDWIHCGQRRYASFTNLDPGTYAFMVRGTNGDGVWNETPLRIVIRVIPPYWMTWWFKLLTAVTLLAAGAAGTWLWIRSVRGRETLRRRSVESQLQALRLQVNPHFIFNALSSIQHLILAKERDQAVDYLSRFSRLVRAVLENSERTSIPIAEEIENLRHYLHLESLRFEGRFDYAIEIDPTLDIHHLDIPTMLIQPYVENSIRHGLLHKPGEGHLLIAIDRRGELIRCVIEDNGIGRKRAAEIRHNITGHGRSMGMRVTQERLGILNAASGNRQPISMAIIDLTDTHGTPCGTRVELFIPIEFA